MPYCSIGNFWSTGFEMYSGFCQIIWIKQHSFYLKMLSVYQLSVYEAFLFSSILCQCNSFITGFIIIFHTFYYFIFTDFSRSTYVHFPCRCHFLFINLHTKCPNLLKALSFYDIYSSLITSFLISFILRMLFTLHRYFISIVCSPLFGCQGQNWFMNCYAIIFCSISLLIKENYLMHSADLLFYVGIVVSILFFHACRYLDVCLFYIFITNVIYTLLFVSFLQPLLYLSILIFIF